MFQGSPTGLNHFLKRIIDRNGSERHRNRKETSPFEIEFESTLKYVELPAFEISKTESFNARVEAYEILQWLKNKNHGGVTKILELKVNDALHDPHSEEIIEEAIKDFDIETLNWKRTDLSINTVQKAAPNVRKLHLYSSGNWVSLSHWLGPEGVIMLKKVRFYFLSMNRFGEMDKIGKAEHHWLILYSLREYISRLSA